MSIKVWILLIGLTSITFLMGYLELVSPFVVVILLLSVFIKGHMISEYYMGLREVKFIYRIIPTVWLIFVLSLISYTYYFPI